MRTLLLLGLLGCARELPPPVVPQPVVPVPRVPLGPPPVGETTVLIDASEPAQVDEVTSVVTGIGYDRHGTFASHGVATRAICLTPCAAHLTQGLHELQLARIADGSWAGTGRIEVGAETTAYRYNLGHRDLHLAARGTGALAVLLGGIGVGVGVPLWVAGDGGVARAGSYVTGASVGLTALGVALLAIFRPDIQNGSGLQWPVPR